MSTSPSSSPEIPMLRFFEPSAMPGDPVPCLTLRRAIRFAFGVRVGSCWLIGSSAESSESLAVYSFPLVTTTLGLFRLFRGNSIPFTRRIKQQTEQRRGRLCAQQLSRSFRFHCRDAQQNSQPVSPKLFSMIFEEKRLIEYGVSIGVQVSSTRRGRLRAQQLSRFSLRKQTKLRTGNQRHSAPHVLSFFGSVDCDVQVPFHCTCGCLQ